MGDGVTPPPLRGEATCQGEDTGRRWDPPYPYPDLGGGPHAVSPPASHPGRAWGRALRGALRESERFLGTPRPSRSLIPIAARGISPRPRLCPSSLTPTRGCGQSGPGAGRDKGPSDRSSISGGRTLPAASPPRGGTAPPAASAPPRGAGSAWAARAVRGPPLPPPPALPRDVDVASPTLRAASPRGTPSCVAPVCGEGAACGAWAHGRSWGHPLRWEKALGSPKECPAWGIPRGGRRRAGRYGAVRGAEVRTVQGSGLRRLPPSSSSSSSSCSSSSFPFSSSSYPSLAPLIAGPLHSWELHVAPSLLSQAALLCLRDGGRRGGGRGWLSSLQVRAGK